jgi:hypothetical protein
VRFLCLHLLRIHRRCRTKTGSERSKGGVLANSAEASKAAAKVGGFQILTRILRVIGVSVVLLTAFVINTWDMMAPALFRADGVIFHQEPSSRFEDWMTPRILKLKEHEDSPSPRVTAVSLGTGNLDYLQNNPCEGRKFMADLVDELNSMHTTLIVIDKYYREKFCSDQLANTRLLTALTDSSARVVVARHTVGLKDGRGGWSLLYDAPFNFLPKKVTPGLIRLNKDDRKIPLQWPVETGVKADPATGESEEWADTLDFAAAKQEDTGLTKRFGLMSFIRDHRDPYMEYPNVRINTVSSQDVLCASSDQVALSTRWNIDCGKASPIALTSIVLLGDESDDDKWEMAGEPHYGYQIQAMYLEALLDGSYFREVPFLVWCSVLILWVVTTQALLAFSERPWPMIGKTTLATIGVVALITVFLVMRNYYPPIAGLLCLGINLVIMILLELVELIVTLRGPAKASTPAPPVEVPKNSLGTA